MKKPGEWSQCRCGEGHQETEETIKAGKCLGCILHDEERDRNWARSCADFGCPFCLSLECTGNCSAKGQHAND